MGDSGRVLGVEQHAELAERSRGSLQRAIPDLIKVSDPRSLRTDLAESEERVWGMSGLAATSAAPGRIAAGWKGRTGA